MRTRNMLILLAATLFVVLLMMASQAGTQKTAAATSNATMAATEEDYGAACEALRTVPKVKATPQAGATPEEGAEEIARPSNPGGPGEALKLTGDPKAGAKIFVDSCQKCHGEAGVGGIKNEGSDDGTIPELNPIDETLVDNDLKVFACNLDLFLEHGSVPSGPSPKETMQPWGDEKLLPPQQIADVISYVMSLNGASPTATPAPTAKK